MIIDELKKEYWKHFNSHGVIDGDVLNAEAEAEIFCDCATEDECDNKQERLLKQIKVLEEFEE